MQALLLQAWPGGMHTPAHCLHLIPMQLLVSDWQADSSKPVQIMCRVQGGRTRCCNSVCICTLLAENKTNRKVPQHQACRSALSLCKSAA